MLYFTPLTFRVYPIIIYNRKAKSFDNIKEKLKEHWKESMTDNIEIFNKWIIDDETLIKSNHIQTLFGSPVKEL